MLQKGQGDYPILFRRKGFGDGKGESRCLPRSLPNPGQRNQERAGERINSLRPSSKGLRGIEEPYRKCQERVCVVVREAAQFRALVHEGHVPRSSFKTITLVSDKGRSCPYNDGLLCSGSAISSSRCLCQKVPTHIPPNIGRAPPPLPVPKGTARPFPLYHPLMWFVCRHIRTARLARHPCW